MAVVNEFAGRRRGKADAVLVVLDLSRDGRCADIDPSGEKRSDEYSPEGV